MKYDNILQTIGDTPIVRLNRIGPSHVDMFVKVESFNPMASVKDRLAYAIIKDARNSGALKPGHHGRNVFHRATQGYARVRR